MTPIQPYFLRAIYSWIVDNGCTPYILVDTSYNGVVVPTQYIENNKIVLNLSPNSVHNLSFNNEWVMFSARFSGSAWDIEIPVPAISAIYAKENGQGMVFDQNKEKVHQSQSPPARTESKKNWRSAKPSLKIVK